MLVRRQDLELGPKRWAGSVAAPDPSPQEGILLSGPIAFGLEAQLLEGDRIGITGWLHAIPRVSCSRCLESTPVVVRREFQLVFQSEDAEARSEEAELDEADLDVDYYPGEGIDLRPILAEQVLLDLPMKPLCGDDCRGLCAQCGQNRNHEECDCEPPVDPRLAALGELRDRL
jgi:uncharacterized protein